MKVGIVSASEYLFSESTQGSLFGSIWKDVLNCDERLGVLVVSEDGGQPVSACLVWDTQRKFFRSLITPPLMPNVGWTWLAYYEKSSTRISKEKEILSALMEYLSSGIWDFWKLDFPHEFKDFQAAIWKGIQPKQKYTYRLSLTSDWREAVDSKLKNILKKKDSFNFEVRPFSRDEFGDFIDSLSSKGVKHAGLLQKVSTEFQENIYTVIGDGGKYKALCLHMNGVAYYLAATNAKENNALSACGLAHCIGIAEEKGVEMFDFEGSMIPEVERFFRGFGGELTSYFSLEKGKGMFYCLRSFIKK
jgi:hypothetical protein